jgi:hypothetical protein
LGNTYLRDAALIGVQHQGPDFEVRLNLFNRGFEPLPPKAHDVVMIQKKLALRTHLDRVFRAFVGWVVRLVVRVVA